MTKKGGSFGRSTSLTRHTDVSLTSWSFENKNETTPKDDSQTTPGPQSVAFGTKNLSGIY